MHPCVGWVKNQADAEFNELLPFHRYPCVPQVIEPEGMIPEEKVQLVSAFVCQCVKLTNRQGRLRDECCKMSDTLLRLRWGRGIQPRQTSPSVGHGDPAQLRHN